MRDVASWIDPWRFPGPLVILLVLRLACATLAAQPDERYLIIGCDNVSTRGTLSTANGETMGKKEASDDDGVGQDTSGSGTSIGGFIFVLQDQNAATTEQYSLILRGDAFGQPDATAGGLLLQTALLTSPSGTGTQSWQITVQFATRATVLPLCSSAYYGLNLPANAAWPTDGLSLHASTYYLFGGTQGDNPAPNAPNLTWSIPGGTGGTPAQPAPMCLNVGLLVRPAVLNLGNVDPTLTGNNCIVGQGNRSFGAGGKWPRHGGGRIDGLDCRVRDGAAANGLFVTFFGVPLGCPGIPLPGTADGALYLNPTGPFLSVASGLLSASGEGLATILPPGSAPPAVISQPLRFQAFTLGPSFALPGRLSNLATATYLP